MLKNIKNQIGVFKEKSFREKAFFLLPYIMAVIATSRLCELWRLCGGSLAKLIKNAGYLYKTIPRFALIDLMIGVPIGCLIIWYIKWNNKMHSKNTREKEEYGSARWSA